MFQRRKHTLLGQFLKFGVDDHGIIIPVLKRGKAHPVRHRSDYQPLQLPLRHPVRSELAA